MKVVDASVVLAWLLQEVPPQPRERILDDHVSGRVPLIAPELLSTEVANVLVTGARLPPALALEAYDRFRGLEIETYSLGVAEYRAALTVASRYRVSVYDASYAVLALALGLKLMTADGKLARRLARLEVVEAV